MLLDFRLKPNPAVERLAMIPDAIVAPGSIVGRRRLPELFAQLRVSETSRCDSTRSYRVAVALIHHEPTMFTKAG